MKISTIQLGINDDENREQRFSRVERIIDTLEETDFVLLPELWAIGFFSYDRYKSESEALKGETFSRLSEKAKKIGAYIFGGSFVENRGGNYYNTSILINRQGELVGNYSKIHLFGYGSEERKILSPGEKIVVVDTEFGKIGLTICYDLRFPEIYRKLIDNDAEIILNCSAWPYPRTENWTDLNKVRAIENQAYFLSCGCAGYSKGKPFIGRSMVVDPWGTVVGSASERETVLKTEIYPETVKQIRKEFTPLKDRVLK